MNEEKRSVTSNRCNSPVSANEVIRSNSFNVTILCGFGADNIDIQSFINEYVNSIIGVEGKNMDETHCDSTNGDAFWEIFNIIRGFLGFDIGFVRGVGGISNKYSDIYIQDFNMALDSTLVEQQQQCHQLQQQRQPLQLQPLLLGSDDNKMICNGNTIAQEFQLNHNGYDNNGSGDGVAVCYIFSKEKMQRVIGKVQLFMASTPSLNIQKLVALSQHVYNNDNTSNTGNNGNNMNDNNGHGVAIAQRTSLLQSHLNRMDQYFLSQGLDMYKIMMNNNDQQELIQYLFFGFMFDKNALRDVTRVSVLAFKPNIDMPEQQTGDVRFNFVRNFGNKIGECQVELNVGRGYKAVISLRLRWK